MSQSGSAPAPTAEFLATLEAFRQSGIRIDAQGRFCHEGALVEHEGFRQALFRWLDRLPHPDGRYILRLDENRYVYVDVEDTPLLVNTLRWENGHAMLSLSDGSEQPLDVANITIDGDGIIRTWVRSKRLEARLSSAASAALADAIELQPQPQLKLSDGTLAPLGPRTPWPSA